MPSTGFNYSLGLHGSGFIPRSARICRRDVLFHASDPAAPSIEKRALDESWSPSARVGFLRSTVQALRELHNAGGEEPMVHRNLSRVSILVKHDNTPILTGFARTKIPSDVSVASTQIPARGWGETAAPEVRAHGLSAADQRSDVYSLCASTNILFAGREDNLSRRAAALLEGGLADTPSARCSLEALDKSLAELLGESTPPTAPLPARFWTEDQVIRFRDHDYRIVTRLGSGGVGTTFKVVEMIAPQRRILEPTSLR